MQECDLPSSQVHSCMRKKQARNIFSYGHKHGQTVTDRTMLGNANGYQMSNYSAVLVTATVDKTSVNIDNSGRTVSVKMIQLFHDYVNQSKQTRRWDAQQY